MGDDTDFLLLYDLAPPEKRAALLEAFFTHPDERRGFQHIVNDSLLRARLEFEFNQTVPFEQFHLLVEAGFACPTDEFRSRSKLAYGQVLPNVAATDRLRDVPPVVPGLWDVHRFFAPFVEAYIARNHGAGIVATREVLEVALDIEDRAFLALVVDAETGKQVFPDACEQMAAMLAGAENSPDIRQRRRERLDWWSIAGRGVEIHDMLRVRPQADFAPRHLPCDRDALKVLLPADDAPYNPK
ncbi:hypothetical protein MR829_14715 [Paracoccus versutus]|uniref:hypothetical protein n=1 Tax=Paracoccus versutus TaxID=34007 RepID=UPI001FB7DBAB|nr:hypothetical protein [Paracoccus versutus]MCJ1901622.1 hypothetical protein [Paracoccus versutus]